MDPNKNETVENQTEETQVEETQTEETQEDNFDPSAFNTQEEEEETTEETSAYQDPSAESNEEEEDEFEDFTWDDEYEDEDDEITGDVSTDAVEATEETATQAANTSTSDDVNMPTSPEDGGNSSWMQVAQDLNIQANTYEEFINQMKQSTQEKVYITEDQNLVNINNLINMSDEEILKKSLLESESEFTAQDAEDYVHRLKDSGTFSFEAKRVRGAYKKQRKKYLDYLDQEKTKKEKMAQDSAKDFESTFLNTLSKTKSMLGGSVSEAELKATGDYFLSGQFQKDLLSDPEHLRDVAFFAKNKKQVSKRLIAKGASKGKQSMLKNMASRNGAKPGRVVGDPGQPGEFNANRFLND